MRPLDRPALYAASAELDAAVQTTRGIDGFCSSAAWTFAADEALMPARELFCRRGEHGWVSLARSAPGSGLRGLEPLEAAWLLGSPLACSGKPTALAAEFADCLTQEAPRDVVFFSGLAPGTELFDAAVRGLEPNYRLEVDLLPRTRRFRASLAGGVDGFLARRSPSLRLRLRQAERKAKAAGVEFQSLPCDDEASVMEAYARLLEVDARSWKAPSGQGLAVPEMRAFYQAMLPRLAREGAVRGQVARLGDRDVAVILGAVAPAAGELVYRGLQFSFDDAYRPLSLGNLAQLAAVTALTVEGVTLYDLGSEVDYKRRWGELCFETVTLVAVPRALRVWQ